MEFNKLVWCFLISILSMQAGEAANVALNKPATQCHHRDESKYSASLANNGWKGRLQETNSHAEAAVTDLEGGKWWKVDLGGNYYIRDVIIYNRLDCCWNNSNQVYILTASNATPANPALNNNDWTIRWYKHGVVGSTALDYQERIILYTTDIVRHVAIYKESQWTLGLREVEVFNYPNPNDAPDNQIIPSTVQLSSNVQKNDGSTNGNINMFHGLYETVNGKTTWTAQLNKPCNSCYVKIYPHLYKNEARGNGFSKLSSFTVRAHNQTGTTPGWTVCETYNNVQNGPLLVRCNRTGINFVRIKNDKQSEVIELTEVQVFAREPADGIQITYIKSDSYHCVTITWTDRSSIARVESVRWKCTGFDWSSETLTSPSVQSCGHEALSTVTCQVIAIGIGGVSSESEPKSTNTSDCTAPSKPTFKVVAGLNAARTRGNITITDIQVNTIHCNRLKTLIIIVTSPEKPNYSQVRESNFYARYVIGDLDGGRSYTIRITAFNNRYKSSFTETSVTTLALKSGPVSSLSVFGYSTSCIRITWNPPTQPNGVRTGYKVKCGSRAKVTKSATDRSHQECNYSPNYDVTCTVNAVNGFGDGVLDSRNGTTFCGKPSTPTFNLADAGTHIINGERRRKLQVSNIQKTQHNCNRLNKVEIFLYRGQALIGNKVTQNGIDIGNNLDYWNLDAVTEYRVEILAYNDKNNVSNKGVQTRTTGELPPGQVNSFTVNGINSSCVRVVWTPPTVTNGVIRSYNISCTNQVDVISGSGARSRSICGYTPYKSVSCIIKAVNSFQGEQRTASNGTWCEIPSTPTFDLTDAGNHTNNNGTFRRKIRVSNIQVDNINCADLKMTKFKLHSGTTMVYNREFQNKNDREILDLDAVTDYRVEVSVVNNGNSNSGESEPGEMSITTGELPPGTAPVIVRLDLNSSCGMLEWGQPVEPNGVIRYYQVDCRNEERQKLQRILKSDQKQYHFCNLTSASRVNCTLTANNSMGWSPAATIKRYTEIAFRESPQPPKATPSPEIIQISIDAIRFANEKTQLDYYQIIVERVNDRRTNRRRRDTSESVVRSEMLYDFTTAESMNLTYYVAGRLYNQTEDNIDFVCGDNQTYGGYYNKRLEAGVDYKIHYTYTVNLGGERVPYLKTSTNAYRLADPPTGRPPNLALLGLIALFILPLAAVGVILVRRRRSGRKTKKKTHGEISITELSHIPDSTTSTHSVKPIKENVVQSKPHGKSRRKTNQYEDPGERPEPYGSSYENVYYDFNSAIKYDKAILRLFVESGATTREVQYKAIEKIPKGDMSASRLEENEGKNRYKGLYPVNSYRVVLKDNPTGTDYINASYIPGYERPEKYIAAMGPNAKTLNDFLVMIWEQKVQTVVMLTGLIEDGKHKCERYWPKTRTPEKIGSFTVTLQTVESWADFAIRTLMIKDQSGEKHRLTQYHYVNWPDHGVPAHTAPYVMFYKIVAERERRLTSQAPILVHCSAGVGRTGTFIGLDYLVEQGKEEKKVDFYACVSKLRTYRPSMVQKLEQYHFLHASLLDYIETEKFTSDVTIMDQKIAQCTSRPEKSIIVEEYDLIENELVKVEHDYASSEDERNLPKIADPNILPDDNNRICLSNAATNYINAITVSSFRNKSQFIVTQIPLAATIRDFWVMISEKRITSIIQVEPSEVNCIPSPGETLKLGDYSVKHKQADTDRDVEIIKLLMTPSHSDDSSEEAEEITVFRYTGWEQGDITPDEQSLIDLYRIVQQKVKDPYNTPTVVMCRNGATKCGLYVNMYSILEKLEIEQMVDIYRSVLLSRIIRPQFIDDIESYGYLYKITSTFAESFADYSNFQ